MQARKKAWIFVLIGCAFLMFPGEGPLAKMMSKTHRVSALVRPAALYPSVLPALENGVPWDMTLGGMQFANVTIEVPAGATRLTVTLTQGAGDLDLYLKFGSKVSGSTIPELDSDADTRSDGPTADETIEITPSTTPALKQGTWYIAALNLKSYTTSFKVTATYETAVPPSQEEKHQITSTATPEAITPGVGLTWKYEVTPAGMEVGVDLAVAIALPDGSLIFLGDQGLSGEPQVCRWGVPVTSSLSGYLFYNLPFPSGVPVGDYGFYTVLVKGGNILYDPENWVSDLGASVISFSPVSPIQSSFISHYGYPNVFVKSFGEDYDGPRIDETWTYTSAGLIASFINATFVGEETLSAPGGGSSGVPAHPEDYRFDTRVEDILSKHGQPAEIQKYAVWDGKFENYVYPGVVFGLHNDRVVSAAGYGPNKAPEYGTPKQLGGGPESFGAADAEVSEGGFNSAPMFALGSILGAAAHEKVPGAQEKLDACMERLRTGQPDNGDAQCFQDALESLAADMTGGLGHAGIGDDMLDWLRQSALALKARWSSTPSPTPTTDGGKTGCCASAWPSRPMWGEKVVFELGIASMLGDQVESVHVCGPGLSATVMPGVTDRIWMYEWTVPDAVTAGHNHYSLLAYSKSGKICGTSVMLDIGAGVRAPSSFLSVSPNPIRIGETATFTAWMTEGREPFTYKWQLGGETFSVGPVGRESNVQRRSFTQPGSHTATVSIIDGETGVGYGTGVTLTVLPDELRARFTHQDSHLKVGEGGAWQVSASGGTQPYSYLFQFSGGSPSSGDNFGTNTFDKKGVYQLTVTVRDSGAPQMTASIGCNIIAEEVCEPPKMLCGPNCIPASGECCFPGTGGWCRDQCCGPGCCDAEMVCCHGMDCCLAGENCCPGGNCCRAGSPCCGGSHCCPDSSWYCCPDQTGCCPIGYECSGDGKCTKGSSMVPMRVTEVERKGFSNCYERSYGE